MFTAKTFSIARSNLRQKHFRICICVHTSAPFDVMNLHEIKMHITQHILNDEIPLILKISIIMLSL